MFAKFAKLNFSNISKFSHLNCKNFSTLLVPQIIHNKDTKSQRLHQSVLNLTTAAHQLDKDVHVLLYSADPISQDLINEAKAVKNVTKVITYTNSKFDFNEPSAEILSDLVAGVHKNYKQYEYVLAASNNFGKNFLPRLGGYLDVQPISDVCHVEEGKNVFSRYFYAGNAICKVESQQKTNVMTIRLTSFEKSVEKNINDAQVEDISSNAEINNHLSGIRSSQFVENLTTKSDKTELSQAKVVVAGGRALKSTENFKIVEDLAAQFENAAIGASRAAVDAGYVPNDLQVGQTGKTVAPELYFAIGISGAIQHVAGMKDSKVIVAINTDADSPIFNYANYGLVGDLFKVVPELTEKIKVAKHK
jgi:electron transfer flavoprotein alpha subunit